MSGVLVKNVCQLTQRGMGKNRIRETEKRWQGKCSDPMKVGIDVLKMVHALFLYAPLDEIEEEIIEGSNNQLAQLNQPPLAPYAPNMLCRLPLCLVVLSKIQQIAKM